MSAPGGRADLGRLVLLLLLLVSLCVAAVARNRIWRDGVALWESAARGSPSKIRLLVNLGNAYYYSGKHDEALRTYQRVIALDPHMAIKAYGNIGNIYFDKKEYTRAAEVFTRILAMNANDFPSYAGRGKVFYMMGRYEEAVRDMDRALALSPGTARYYVYRGEAYLGLNDRIRAEEDLRTACRKGWDEGCKRLKELGLE